MDVAFDDVLGGCAERDGCGSPMMQRAYADLHRAGVAHSLEVWAGEQLIGGLYGVLTGGVFSGGSMFHRVSDASKVAVVDICNRLDEVGAVVIDTEQESEHLTRLGQLLVEREDYGDLAHRFRDQDVETARERLPVARLVRTARHARMEP